MGLSEKVTGIFDFELFSNRKCHVLDPWLCGPCRGGRSTVPQWLTGDGAMEKRVWGVRLGPHQGEGGGVVTR
jgi:hypothetical protein